MSECKFDLLFFNVCELGRFICTRSLLNLGFVISVILFIFACVFHPALHDLDPVFRDFSRSEKVSALAASLGYKRPAPIQSMYIYKVWLVPIRYYNELLTGFMIFFSLEVFFDGWYQEWQNLSYVLYLGYLGTATGDRRRGGASSGQHIFVH